jgi:SNW domain-containing protein 1
LQSGNNAQYLRYKIDQSGLQTESEEHRIIKLHTIPVDPMEPAKFRRKKVPRNAQNLPVPVLHSAEKQMRTETAVDWNIPPSISNWKNPKGYSIPLDKRLAADGRNLHEQQINDNFANLSEVSVSSNLSLLNQFSAGIIFSRTSGERCNPNAWSDS